MTVVPLPLEQNHRGNTLVHGADGGSVDQGIAAVVLLKRQGYNRH